MYTTWPKCALWGISIPSYASQWCGMLSSSDIAGRLLPVVPTGGSFPVGPIDTAGPDGPVVAGGPVGPIWTMPPSDSDPDPADPTGLCAVGGPDGTLSPFILDHAGPAGRHVAIGPVGPFGMLSPSDCHPAQRPCQPRWDVVSVYP